MSCPRTANFACSNSLPKCGAVREFLSKCGTAFWGNCAAWSAPSRADAACSPTCNQPSATVTALASVSPNLSATKSKISGNLPKMSRPAQPASPKSFQPLPPRSVPVTPPNLAPVAYGSRRIARPPPRPLHRYHRFFGAPHGPPRSSRSSSPMPTPAARSPTATLNSPVPSYIKTSSPPKPPAGKPPPIPCATTSPPSPGIAAARSPPTAPEPTFFGSPPSINATTVTSPSCSTSLAPTIPWRTIVLVCTTCLTHNCLPTSTACTRRHCLGKL